MSAKLSSRRERPLTREAAWLAHQRRRLAAVGESLAAWGTLVAEEARALDALAAGVAAVGAEAVCRVGGGFEYAEPALHVARWRMRCMQRCLQEERDDICGTYATYEKEIYLWCQERAKFEGRYHPRRLPKASSLPAIGDMYHTPRATFAHPDRGRSRRLCSTAAGCR